MDYTLKKVYLGKDGRYRAYVKHKNGKSSTVSYPRVLMEKHLNRSLLVNEQVDHINGDVTDNRIENLQILEFKEHQRLDVKRNKELEFTCPTCLTTFLKKVDSQFIRSRKIGKSGPFCSKSCSGKYGTSIQHHNKEKLEIVEVNREFFKLKDS